MNTKQKLIESLYRPFIRMAWRQYVRNGRTPEDFKDWLNLVIDCYEWKKRLGPV